MHTVWGNVLSMLTIRRTVIVRRTCCRAAGGSALVCGSAEHVVVIVRCVDFIGCSVQHVFRAAGEWTYCDVIMTRSDFSTYISCSSALYEFLCVMFELFSST